MPAVHGLLGLLWLSLSPKDPNFLDRTFGSFTDYKLTADNQVWLAMSMLGLYAAALIWRGVRQRKLTIGLGQQPKTVLQMLSPELDKTLARPDVQTWGGRVVTAFLLCFALLASVNYFYGTRNDGTYLHRWDAFHTVIGAKYHRELGYFDLYKCAYAIDKEGPRHFRAVKDIRDLRTRKFEPADQHIADNDCKQRFTPERLEEFKHDLNEFGTWSSKSQWKILMKDKGFNGTPFYATVCKLLINSVELTLDGLRRLAVIDPILMLIAFGVVGWAYGARTAAIVAIFFCVFFPNRFTHMGGSILRFDYDAALLIGFAALKKDKWGLAGGMFAWATMVRVFPAIFAVGVGIKIASDVIAGRKLAIRDEHWRFVGWYAGLLVLFFVISLIGMDGGFDNWRTWYENMKIHNSRSASFRVGFKHLFMFDGQLTGNDYNLKQQNFVARESYYWAAVALLLAPLLLAVRRLDTVSFAAMFGVFGFFLLAVATRYYYGVVAILFLIDRQLLTNRFMLMLGAFLFAATAFDFTYFALNDSDSLMYNVIVGVELTIVVAAVGSWLLFNPSLLDVGEDPRLPANVAAARGARAEPVALVPAKLPMAKPGQLEADIETQTDGDGDPSTAAKRVLAALAAEQAPPSYDPHEVTVSDVGKPPVSPDDVTKRDPPVVKD